MGFDAFGVFIGQYKASLPTLTDGDIAVVSLDVNGRALIADGGGSITVDNNGTFAVQAACTQSTSPWVVSANGGSFVVTNAVLTSLDHQDGAAWNANDHGIEMLAVRKDATGPLTGVDDGDYSPLQVDANGNLKVSGSFTASVDDVFESGTEADASSDPTGDGIVPITNAMTDVVSIAVASGTYYITGLDVAADKNGMYELIVDDNGTPTEWIRVGVLNSAQPELHKGFERAIEITGQADRSLKLRARVTVGTAGNASGGINGYTK